MRNSSGAIAALLAILFPVALLCHAQGQEQAGVVRLKLMGASPAATIAHPSTAPVKSHFFTSDEKERERAGLPQLMCTYYHDVYPGIDVITYGDQYQLEYVFLVRPGGDPSLIRLAFDRPEALSITQTGSCVVQLGSSGEIIISPPFAFLMTKDSTTRLSAWHQPGYDNSIGIVMGKEYYDLFAKLNKTIFNLVPKAGQPGGPGYDFYVSKFEVTNDQFLRFLNDAEANQKTPRGSNMFFSRNGDIWISPEQKSDRDEMFDISDSTLTYDRTKPEGARYDHLRLPNGVPPYTNHPISGVSWYGSVKYCNWLTLRAGRGDAECCYTEGTNGLDWAPVTGTNWANGLFGDAERAPWLASKGFRLPMVNCDVPLITTNSYNEFYKAAAWCGTTNRLYGFGRDTTDGTDANCRGTVSREEGGPMAVGFFNGNEFLGKIRTRRNENFYGIHDLSGNAMEWVNDFAKQGAPDGRLLCGGSWANNLNPATRSWAALPCTTDIFGGFRSMTTYLPSEVIAIHLLFSFYMEPAALALRKATIEEPRPVAAEEAPEEVPPEGVSRLEATAGEITPNGLAYKGVLPAVAGPEEAGRGPGLPFPPLLPPSPPMATNILSVQSFGPSSGVTIGVTPDVNGNGDGSTPFQRLYVTGSTVQLTAPPIAGGNTFQRWLRNGFFYSLDQVITVTITADITMTAVYTYAPPTVTLRFNPDNIAYTDPGSTLTATPFGGSGIFVAYEYQYILLHHTWNPVWIPSSLTGQITVFDWNYSIKYRVRVQDSFGTWSDWSNEAILIVGPPKVPDPSKTQSGL